MGEGAFAKWLETHHAVSVAAPAAEAATKARPLSLPAPRATSSQAARAGGGHLSSGGAFADRRVPVGGTASHPSVPADPAISFDAMFA
eukprot:CAMPEP_0180284290 /NCGR_PEP_ID=MMETSP0988-20121125/11082_1 /TAXON_ID=697907 /ORGANISM="non described non described, Strain CCMP2293" /LENGTH=87 /DNA_ID=CAMNT_0022257183 /DNA_START=89 /DNA_END=352 /DNA_ORIENTATION=+